MLVRLFLLRRHGRRLRWRNSQNAPPLAGSLSLHQLATRAAGTVFVLSLSSPDDQASTGTLATLYDPLLISLGSGVLVFRGIERINGDGGHTGYAQEWRCELQERAYNLR